MIALNVQLSQSSLSPGLAGFAPQPRLQSPGGEHQAHGTQDSAANRQQDPAPEIPAAAAFEYRGSETRHSLRIEIETLEGDLVTVRLDQFAGSHASALNVADESGSGQAVSREVSRESRLSFTLEGNLDREERRAIGRLLRKLDKLADRFFQGNLEGALRQTARLGFDDRQLAGFALNLSASRSLQAVSAYHQVASQAEAPDLAQAVAYAGELHQLSGSEAGRFLRHPGKSAGALLSAMIARKAASLGLEGPQQGALRRLEKLVERGFEPAPPQT